MGAVIVIKLDDVAVDFVRRIDALFAMDREASAAKITQTNWRMSCERWRIENLSKWLP